MGALKCPTEPNLDTGQEHFEIVSDPQTLRSLQGEWEALTVGRNGLVSHKVSFGAGQVRETVERPRARKLHCVVLRRGERLVLLWPFTIRRKKFLTLAEPLGCAYSEYPDPLVEDGDEGFGRVKAAWQFLRSTCRCDLIDPGDTFLRVRSPYIAYCRAGMHSLTPHSPILG